MIDVVVLWIVNELGELLLAQRALDKRQDPGVWGPSVTGKVESGETYDETLAREVHEELSLGPEDYQPIPILENVFSHPDKELRRFVIYAAFLPKDQTERIQFDQAEVAAVDWGSIDAVTRWIATAPTDLVPSARAVWPETFAALRRLGPPFRIPDA